MAGLKASQNCTFADHSLMDADEAILHVLTDDLTVLALCGYPGTTATWTVICAVSDVESLSETFNRSNRTFEINGDDRSALSSMKTSDGLLTLISC